MSIRATLTSQFHEPTGALGRLAGLIMFHRPSNRLRNDWVVQLLDVPEDATVLEIGFGPGYAISRLADAVPRGKVVGIDHSLEMVRVASKRNRSAIAGGSVELHHLPVDAIDEILGEFDRIVAVNTHPFWTNRIALLRKLRMRLAPGGRLLIAVQPRSKGADRETARRMADRSEEELRAAGFRNVRTLEHDLRPPVVCTIGEKDV